MTMDTLQEALKGVDALDSDVAEESTQTELDSEKIKLFSGFSKLTRNQRYNRLVQMGGLSKEDVRYLRSGAIKSLDLADKLIENVVGYFQMPLGVATNFIIDGKPVIIPMAVEETSIIAAASKTARFVSEHGSIQTFSQERQSIGQIQIHSVKDFSKLEQVIQKNKQKWIQDVNTQVIPSMLARGGGMQSLQLRKIEYEGQEMAVIHVLVDTCNAMGANIVNQVCEYLKHPIESTSGEDVSICILSNLADQCLASTRIVLKNLDITLMKKIENASKFAEADPYRAATSNKGVMNGISAVLIATGNDFRAVESAVHAYSARNGSYRSITRWRVKDQELHGMIEVPMMVGVVGGMTRIHPTAKICMKMMGVDSAEGLARICSAVGLVQNLGAIRALTTVGIIEGHMKLHIRNLTWDAGAKGWEFSVIQKHLENLLKFRKRITLTHAKQALKLIRDRIKQVDDFKTLNKQKWAKDLLQELLKEQ
ncbi:MAG: hydroxymethylglutaryl-CoA reductase, degradative [Bdellovibrionales bacterium]|nr:hydroxymethylglutaryl-CoA reductase, degradative [Bdellovibrionales bacterium]